MISVNNTIFNNFSDISVLLIPIQIYNCTAEEVESIQLFGNSLIIIRSLTHCLPNIEMLTSSYIHVLATSNVNHFRFVAAVKHLNLFELISEVTTLSNDII
jgi:hypothetical protein